MMAARMAWLDRVPLKRKLAALMVLVMGASFGASALITGIYGYRADRRAMEHHLDILASAIGDNCSAALVFDDEAAAAEVLSALVSDGSITRAVLTDEHAVVVARFPAGQPGAEWPDGGHGSLFEGELRADRSITVDGRTVGYLSIRAETAAILTRAATEAVVALTAFLVGVLVVLMLFERMQRLVTAPLVDLQETVRRVVRSRNYSLRAARSADDELNDVVMAVNDLLAQMEAHVGERAPSAQPQSATPEPAQSPASSR